ncbi:MAG TPA: hypothetical protein VM639_15585 [Dongiaceae bacterium]|nr:hypothetical protein [Dongiaceae bacterium]
MQSHELYRKYREKLEELSRAQGSQAQRDADLLALMRQFETEASKLDLRRARQLCEELCEQLEHEASFSVNPQRRDIMLRATKTIGLMPFASSSK